MKHFRVFLKGHNYRIELDGKIERMGFFAYRVVEGPTVQEARRLAVATILSDPWLLESARNSPGDPPLVDVEEVVEVPETFEVGTGLSWFPDRDN